MFNQYMFGDALLVAPILTAGATSRSVYLPAGNWTDYNDKLTRYTGPTTITAAAPLDVIPRFVKAGAIIPRGDIIKSNNNWTPNWAPNLHIEFFPAQGITSSFLYYTGASTVQMIGTMSGNTVWLKFNNLGVDGKLEVYNIPGFTSVVRNGQTLTAGTDFQYDAAAQRLVIPYSGPTALIVTLSSS
jgi:alpha-glucosidase (family GH31 glycosyl hydrolase)